MMDFEIVLNLRTMSLNCTRKLFRLTSSLYSYLYQYNVPNISILLNTIFFGLIDQNINDRGWLQEKECDGVKDVGVLDEDGELTIGGEVGGGKERSKKKTMSRKTKTLKARGMLG